jgi:hypothetical protein
MNGRVLSDPTAITRDFGLHEIKRQDQRADKHVGEAVADLP